MAAAFELTAAGLTYPAVTQTAGRATQIVPASLLQAIGWVESGWRQYTARGNPIVSSDFGYGVMQVTSGMPGASGKIAGDLSPPIATRIASEYRYNIAYGMRILLAKWSQVPKIGNGDHTVLEDWYYAVWAYNGWGWVNNPNNPRFARSGTPATDPTTYPYQERVLYLVAHPPRDSEGNPLWRAIPVTLPERHAIAYTPGPFTPQRSHREPPSALDAIYSSSPLSSSRPSAMQAVTVTLVNTGSKSWPASGDSAVSLTYHVLSTSGHPWRPASPFGPGVLAFGQRPVSLPHDVLPGKSVTLSASIQSPPEAGAFWIVWDLAVASGPWFSQMRILPRAQRLHVSSPDSTPAGPTATVATLNSPVEDMRYVADTSIPDGSAVAAAATFEKGWLIYNDGRTRWGPRWSLIRTSGKTFGARHIPIAATGACHTLNVVASLQAPKAAGNYTSAWRLRDPSGRLVGQRLTLVVHVLRTGPVPTPSPTVSPTAAPTQQPGPTPTPTPSG